MLDFLTLLKTNKADASTDTTELFEDTINLKNESKILNDSANSNEKKLMTLLQVKCLKIFIALIF